MNKINKIAKARLLLFQALKMLDDIPDAKSYLKKTIAKLDLYQKKQIKKISYQKQEAEKLSVKKLSPKEIQDALELIDQQLEELKPEETTENQILND